MENHFDDFIEALAAVEVGADAFNQYARNSPDNAIRRENLRLYLRQMASHRPHVLLVGEAPGYQGCRLSGIPFTSEYIMLNGVPGVPIFGEAHGYRKTEEIERVKKEPSATIVWNTIAAVGILPLIWSAFPFHPHRAGNPWSNRPPRAGELAIGQRFLADILRLFAVDLVVAVGNKADQSLTRMNIPHTKVRHPSQGGKADFVAGIEAIARQVQHDRKE